jgi:hypothetical protein
MDQIKTILAIFGALVLAVFAKRYSDLKKKALGSQKKDVELEKKKIILENDNTNLIDLVERENKRRTDNDT